MRGTNKESSSRRVSYVRWQSGSLHLHTISTILTLLPDQRTRSSSKSIGVVGRVLACRYPHYSSLADLGGISSLLQHPVSLALSAHVVLLRDVSSMPAPLSSPNTNRDISRTESPPRGATNTRCPPISSAQRDLSHRELPSCYLVLPRGRTAIAKGLSSD